MEECDLGVMEAGESDDDSREDTDWEFDDTDTADSSDTDEEDWLCKVETDNGSGECEYGPKKDCKPLDHSTQIEFLELLFQLSITLSKQELNDGNACSTLLVYFSGIFGFSSENQHFRLAREFCPSLSGIIYIQRLPFLEYSLPLFGYSSITVLQRPRAQQLEHFKERCGHYIVAGSPSALAELFSLRSFGYKIGKTWIGS